MKFCDKLAKQRKNNNLSQEQLAEILGVSRQAVSKWESGSSYPDMEKIIQMCNILNCTLEDLLDDGTIKENTQTSKITFNNYLQDLLKFITKTYNMFCSMKFKQKLMCIFELLICSSVIFIVGLCIFAIVNSITYNLLDIIPFHFKNYIEIIFENIYIVILLIIGIIIIIHLFKIRYLDYYITIEDNNIKQKSIEEEIIENKKEIKQVKKEKIIIRDPKHSSFSFISLLGKIVLYTVKIFVSICAIPIAMIFIFLIFCLIISLIHIPYGVLFLFISLALLGSSLLVAIFIYFIYNFIFNIKQYFRIVFIVFITSLILIGLGMGLSFTTLLNYDTSTISDDQLTTKIEYIEPVENQKLDLYINYETEYAIDNSLTNIKLEITYPKFFEYKIMKHIYKSDQNQIVTSYNLYMRETNISDVYKSLLNDLKKKKIMLDLDEKIKVKIYLSQEAYNNLIV